MLVEGLIKFLISEHKKEPIQGHVLVLGKQAMMVSLAKLREIFDEQDCKINPQFVSSNNVIDDEQFFHMFSNVSYDAMDISAREGATIIQDLNYPIPKDLEGKFDFIVDGGTFDHLFDLKTAFANVVKMLKPGGRIFQWNAASNYANASYLSFGADFFYDYYLVNKFEKCKTFFAESFEMAAQNWDIYEFLPANSENRQYSPFRESLFFVMVLVLAKKGKDSTYDQLPTQLQYRDRKSFQNISINEHFLIKTMPFSKVNATEKQRQLYFSNNKPNENSYRHIGWL